MGNRCRCAPSDLKRYQKRISGPLRDRFDLEARVEPVDAAALVGEDETTADGPDPAIARARAAQQARCKALGLPAVANARIPAGALPGAVRPSAEARRLLVDRARAIGLTGRGVHRVLRVARTLADLEGAEAVEEKHVFEAAGWRSA